MPNPSPSTPRAELIADVIRQHLDCDCLGAQFPSAAVATSETWLAHTAAEIDAALPRPGRPVGSPAKPKTGAEWDTYLKAHPLHPQGRPQ